MKANKISVIVPVFNVENYLEKCVKSIIEQTYKNLEVILVDDGSTDKSGFLCDELKKQDYRIKVIHKTNGGLSDARNAGIQVSTGKYLSFIDSDDYLERTALEQMMQAILISHSEIAICNIMRFYDDGCTEEFYNPTDNQEVLEGIRRFDTLNGELQNLVRMVLKKMRKDVSCEITAELFEEPVEKIRKIYEVAEKYAPEYDIESICRELAA